MFKALLKKQILETFSTLFYGNGNKKKQRSGGAVGILLLAAFVALALGGAFFFVAFSLCAPLVAAGLDWVFFALIGTMATALGVIGSVFATKSKLYDAKDNDLLLSMPIPARLVLFSRLAGLYAFTLLFESMVFLPAVVCYFVVGGFAPLALVGCLLVWLVLPLGALALCCLLGWLIALLSARLPMKNLTSVLLTVGFIVVYLIVYSKINDYLNYIVLHGEGVGRVMNGWLYPFGQVGYACVGKPLSWLIFLAIFGGVFALVYLLLSKTYLRLATVNRGARKVKYKGKGYGAGSAFSSLVKREALRYTKNPMVAMNCLLGTLFLIVLPFLSLFLGELRAGVLSGDYDRIVAPVIAAIVCIAATMNTVSATSVSLEGENLWIVRSAPVATEKVLFSKAFFHCLTTGIPALFACVFLCIVFRVNVFLSIGTAIVCLLFTLTCALLGLAINLKLPKLDWTNEVALVKQSFSPMAAMFAEWGLELVLVGVFIALSIPLPVWVCYIAVGALLLAGSLLLVLWLKKGGKEVFEGL